MAAFRKFIGFLLLCPVEQRLLIAPHQAVIVEQIGKLVGWMPIVQNDGGVAVYLHRVKQVAVLLFGVGILLDRRLHDDIQGRNCIAADDDGRVD